MSRQGRRYNRNEKKLNIKKVAAVIIAFAFIIMMIVGSTKLLTRETSVEEKAVATKYFAAYTNGKWGVINSKGETIINPQYDETIIIPDNLKDVFVCTYNVDYANGTYQTKVINSKNEELIKGYETIEVLENYDSSNNIWYENDVLKVSKDGKYGLVDFKGKELLSCEYDTIEALKGVKNSILISKDGKYGLVDNIGATLIDVNFNKIEPLSEKYENGYIVTSQDGKKGIINHNKTIALETKYEDIQKNYGDGKYIVKENGKWQIVDSQGNTYLKEKFDIVKSINSENVIVKQKNKYGIAKLEGTEKIKAEYVDISYAFGENYIAKKDKKYGIINLEGQTLVNFVYSSLIYNKEAGFFEGSKQNSVESEFIGNDMQVKLTGILSEISIELGYMKLRTDGEYKYYNFKFEEKTNIELLKSNTIFLSQKNGKYGYVNKEGIVVVDYIYDDAKEQNEFGFASVKKDGMWGCIDTKGKVFITPAYELQNSPVVEFIGSWHRGEDLNLNYYTK